MRVKSALRYELKYLISRAQYHAVLGEIAARMRPDTFGDTTGAYPVTSLYYDTPDYKAFWDKLEGHKMRRKVRVRVYGHAVAAPNAPVFLEIKQRVDKRMAKRRARLPYAQAVDLAGLTDAADRVRAEDVAGAEDAAEDAAVMREVAYLHGALQLQPACVVTYDRLAFEGDEHFPDLRVTFDTSVRGRTRMLSLLADERGEDVRVLPADRAILEVKVNHAAPFWLTKLLSDHGCVLRRISKYCATLEQNAVVGARQRIIHSQSR